MGEEEEIAPDLLDHGRVAADQRRAQRAGQQLDDGMAAGADRVGVAGADGAIDPQIRTNGVSWLTKDWIASTRFTLGWRSTIRISIRSMTAMAGSSLLLDDAVSAAFASCRRVAWTLACSRRHASSCQTSAVRRWPSKNDRSGRRNVPNTRQTIQALAAGCMAVAMLASTAMAEDPSRIALVPGGPHPYFSAWEQAGKDATRDFKLGAADYRVPQKWELSQQNAAAREPADPGLQRLPDLPRRSRRLERTVERAGRDGRAR